MAAPVVIAASAKHKATLIFLHGLGDTGQGWASVMDMIRPPHAKVICPTAPTIPVTLNDGYRMSSWFDLYTLDADGPEDENGIKSVSKQIHGIIKGEVGNGIKASNILLGGFSQGGALALYSALVYPQKLAGVLALSCWLPLQENFPDEMKCSSDLQVLQCHGDSDTVVSYEWGQSSASILKSLLKNPVFKTYRGLIHSFSDDELDDSKDFVQANL